MKDDEARMGWHATRSALAFGALLGALLGARADAADEAAPVRALATAAVRVAATADSAAYDGVVEAVRQTVIAAQVAGAVVALDVRAGDTVKSGQVLLRLDARAAEQTAAAGAAQVQAARALQEAATKDFERQKQLFEQHYISQAALDRAQAEYRTAQAQAAAQLASAGAARTQSGFYVVKAPYAGVVSDVAVVLGDMAMPGRALVTLYDPAVLRVSAAVPQTVASRHNAQPLQAEIPGAADARITPVKAQFLPTVDPATHSVELQLALPPGLAGVTPGMFARVWLAGASGGAARLFVPLAAVVRRAEMTAVYVVGAEGRPLLRQVRLGRAEGGNIEVLAGVAAGERVALDPQAAARVR